MMEVLLTVIFLLTVGTFVTWLRAYGYPTYLKDRDSLAGGTKQEKLRNWMLMTTLLWATIIPFFVALPLMMQLGYLIALRYEIPTDGRDAHLLYALGYLFVVALPLSTMSSLLGKIIWKRVAGIYVSPRLVEKVYNDKWWKRAGGD